MELLKLVGLTLNRLTRKSGLISEKDRKKLVQRATNISILLTTFVSRLDYSEVLSGYKCAKMLSDLYRLIIPFSTFNGLNALNENEISHLNLALTHICSVKIRNSKQFVRDLSLNIDNLYRKTLERYHWFATKTNYIIDDGKEVSDSHFRFGIKEVPFNTEEADGMQALLKKFYLTEEGESLDKFEYQSDGQNIKITSSKDDKKSLILNLLSGEVIRDGFLVIKSHRITNSDRFKNLFKPKENPEALKGSTYSVGDRELYILADFKGSSYIIDNKRETVLGYNDNTSVEIDNISIRRKWNDNWYKLVDSEDTDNVCKLIKHTWHGNVRFYSRLRSQYLKETAAFYGHEKDPFMRVIVSRKLGSMRIIIRGMKEESDFRLLDSDQKDYEKHLKNFDSKEFHTVKDKFDNLMLIYPKYRLAEDPSRPFTLYKEHGKDEIETLNISNMMICNNQAIMGKESIPGALLAIIDGSKKVLLLPRWDKTEEERKGNFNYKAYIPEPKEYVQIEKIPVVDDMPAPQSRLHKLLLAYYLLLSHDYNSARELLNPNHLHQNEPFSKDELNIMDWIVKIRIESPEVTAMKLLIYAHFLVNQDKFPLSYADLREKIEKKVITDIKLDLIEKVPENHSINYLYAVRELSEKYYVHRIFPEILNDNLFEKIFGVLKNFRLTIHYDEDVEKAGDYYYDISWDWKERANAPKSKLSSGALYYFLDKDKRKPIELDFIRKLAVKNLYSGCYVVYRMLATYCYAVKPSLWEEFINLIENNANRLIVSDHLKTIMKKCKEEFTQDLEPLNQSHGSRTTEFHDVWMVMRADSKSPSDDIIETELPRKVLVSEEDVSIMNSVRTNLTRLIKPQEPESKFSYFDEEVPSKILKKLVVSISEFIKEKGSSPLNQIEVDGDELRGLLVYLEKRIKGLEEANAEKAAYLTALTSEEVDFNQSKVISSIISLMHHKKTKTFSHLYSCYMRNSLSCIRKKFPQLDVDKCKELKSAASLFFGQKILVDYFGLLKRNLENFLEGEAASVDDLSIFCDELSKIEDFNARIKNPVIMNFEFRSGKQVKDIELLTTRNRNNKFPSVVIQRMMAAGKTLVLGTISVVTKALDPSKLSILVPPSSLYQSNTTAMQARTYSYFKKVGKNFAFPRFSNPKDGRSEMLSNYLDNVLEIIKNTMQNRNYLILSPDSLSSFLNSYIEVLYTAERVKNDNNANFGHLLSKYSEIYRIFKESGSIILDEIDMTMDPRKELNFPTDDNEPYNMIAVDLISDLIEFMLFDGEIKEAGLSIYTNDQASLTKDNYKKCLKAVLNYIRRELTGRHSLWYKYVIEIGNQKIDPELVMEFLSDPKMTTGKLEIKAFREHGNATAADALIIVKSQLHQHLAESLKGTVNMNYGSAGMLRPEIKYAVPYVAANTPSTASVFADRWETLLKTLLMVAASPCDLEIAREVIEYVRKTISTESTAGNILMSETATYKNMKIVLRGEFEDPLALESTNSSHVETVRKKLALRSPTAIRILFGYYINEVFDKMTFPVEQITSNALNMTSMFNSVQGYSGTIDNVNILPQNVIKDAFEDHMKNEKNNGGISLKLIRDCENGKVQELNERAFTRSAVLMVEELMSLYPSESVSAIIDTGAFFKTFKNIQIAEAVLKVCKHRIEAVLYYDEDSNQLEFLRLTGGSFTRGYLETTDPDDIRRATDVEIDKRFTFYDQRHITGSDILQPKEAHAIMTAGPRVLLRDILQGTLRMRQFMTSQKVNLVTTAASREFYSSKIGREKSVLLVSDLLTLGALNEDDKQELENQKLAFVKIDNEIRSFALNELSLIYTNPQNGNQKEFANSLLRNLRSLFIRSIQETPFDWLTEAEEKDSAEVLKSFVETRMNVLRALIDSLDNNISSSSSSSSSIISRFNELEERIAGMLTTGSNETDSLLTYLNPKMKSKIQLDNGTEVQMQNLTLSLVDLNLEALIDGSEGRKIQVNHGDYLLRKLEEEKENKIEYWISLNELYNDEKMGEQYKPLLQDTLITKSNVFVTLDLVRLIETDENSTRFPIFSKYTMEGTHILVQAKDEDIRVFMISNFHASRIKQDLKITRVAATYYLCDLSGDVIVTNDEIININSSNILNIRKLNIKELFFDALIFNGSLPQILANPDLKTIYYQKWLKHQKFMERARFLLLRMKILMGKDEKMFEAEDEDFVNLQKCARGDQIENVDKGYVKGVVWETDELIAEVETGKKEESTCHFDFNDSLKILFGQKELKISIWDIDYDEDIDDYEAEEEAEIVSKPALKPKSNWMKKKKEVYGLNCWEIEEDVDLDPSNE